MTMAAPAPNSECIQTEPTKPVIETSNCWENIVIVPPKPDAYLSQHDSLTYSHLYYCTLAKNNCVSDSSSTSTASTSASESSLESHISSQGKEGKGLSEGPSSPAQTRDPKNGAFTFKVNAEYDLLQHVQQQLHLSAADEMDEIERTKLILHFIDDYCLKKQWMYHVGGDKSYCISAFLWRAIQEFVSRERSLRLDANNPRRIGHRKPTFACVELGTYCGYSALVLASTLRQFLPPDMDFHIFSTETCSKHLEVAQATFCLARMEQVITPILFDPVKENLPAVLRNYLPFEPKHREAGINGNGNARGGIDFLLLDHKKSSYLPDLNDLEGEGLVRAGTFVSADNVIFNQLDAYIAHMKQLESSGIVQTELEELNLEYSTNLKDGIENTIYLKDPPGKRKVCRF